MQKKLGFRMLMDVIPLRPELVKGIHGRKPVAADQGPLLIATRRDLAAESYHIVDIKELILRHWL